MSPNCDFKSQFMPLLHFYSHTALVTNLDEPAEQLLDEQLEFGCLEHGVGGLF